MQDVKLYYADLHWHTHYSDNRDRASVDDMVSQATAFGFRILGTGDHNHNLITTTWEQEKAETREVSGRRPELVLLNNCEMTFMFGHFLVFEPPKVDGTLREAYGYLYDRTPKMINHPGLPTDEWSTRIIPHAAAVEAINGSVIRDAAGQGVELDRFASPLQVPMVRVFASYAECGLPVAAIGSSDAHLLAQLGPGATGFRFPSPPTPTDVIDAIRSRRTFACTDTGIDLHWEIVHASGALRLRWAAHFADRKGGTPAGPSANADAAGNTNAPGNAVPPNAVPRDAVPPNAAPTDAAPSDTSPPDKALADGGGDVQSWLFRGSSVVHESGGHGEAALHSDGVYWIAARSATRFAVSSAIIAADAGDASTAAPSTRPTRPARLVRPVPPNPEAAHRISEAAELILRDLAHLDGPPGRALPARGASAAGARNASNAGRTAAVEHAADTEYAEGAEYPGGGRLEVATFHSESPAPEITDADGTPVPYTLESYIRPKRIIDKEGGQSHFGEFEVWLERNEVHECRFEALETRLEGDIFFLDAALIPGLSDRRIDAAARYRGLLPSMREEVAKASKLRIRVGLLPRLSVRFGKGKWRLPLRVTDPSVDNLVSELHRVHAAREAYDFPETWLPFIPESGVSFLAQFYV